MMQGQVRPPLHSLFEPTPLFAAVQFAPVGLAQEVPPPSFGVSPPCRPLGWVLPAVSCVGLPACHYQNCRYTHNCRKCVTKGRGQQGHPCACPFQYTYTAGQKRTLPLPVGSKGSRAHTWHVTSVMYIHVYTCIYMYIHVCQYYVHYYYMLSLSLLKFICR